MAKRSEMYEQLLEALADNQWHDVDPLVTQLGMLVLPSRAIEMLEQQRQRVSAAKSRRSQLSREEQIVMGRRIMPLAVIAEKSYNGFIQQQTITRNGRDVRQVRRIPDTALSANEVARMCNRSPSTISTWLANEKARAWVQARLPPGISPGYNYGSNGRLWKVPIEAVEIWQAYSLTKPFLNPAGSHEALIDALIEVMEMDTSTEAAQQAAQRTAQRIADGLRAMLIKRRYGVRKITQPILEEGGRRKLYSKDDVTPIKEQESE